MVGSDAYDSGVRLLLAAASLLALVACTSPEPAATPAPLVPSTPAANPARPKIVVLGDSLAAGYGLDQGESFPARLQERLDQRASGFQISNVSVSGDTSAGGLRRLDWALDGDVRILVVDWFVKQRLLWV